MLAFDITQQSTCNLTSTLVFCTISFITELKLTMSYSVYECKVEDFHATWISNSDGPDWKVERAIRKHRVGKNNNAFAHPHIFRSERLKPFEKGIESSRSCPWILLEMPVMSNLLAGRSKTVVVVAVLGWSSSVVRPFALFAKCLANTNFTVSALGSASISMLLRSTLSSSRILICHLPSATVQEVSCQCKWRLLSSIWFEIALKYRSLDPIFYFHFQ